MKTIFSIFLLLGFLSTHLYAQSERSRAIVIPISSIGSLSDSEKLILQNTLSLTKLTQSIAIENIDYIYYHATSSKAQGSLSKIKPALHFEFPKSSRTIKTDEVVAFLSIALHKLALELFP